MLYRKRLRMSWIMHNPRGPFSQRHCVWLQYDWKDVSADLDFILMHKSQVSLCCQTHTKLLYQVAPLCIYEFCVWIACREQAPALLCGEWIIDGVEGEIWTSYTSRPWGGWGRINLPFILPPKPPWRVTKTCGCVQTPQFLMVKILWKGKVTVGKRQRYFFLVI